MKTAQELEDILRKNFNLEMPGVSAKKLTYEQWKKDYPSLYKVIIKSMNELDSHSNAELSAYGKASYISVGNYNNPPADVEMPGEKTIHFSGGSLPEAEFKTFHYVDGNHIKAGPIKAIDVNDFQFNPKWIGLDEQLPGDLQNVLFAGSRGVAGGYTEGKNPDGTLKGYYGENRIQNDVTHWMPLPDPPTI